VRRAVPGLVEGKAGLVTGAAGGIGRATALALAREGAAGVVVNDLESRLADGEETVLGMKYQIPQMLAQSGGAIVNTASLAGLIAVPALGAYIASKLGVVGLTKTAALQFANQGIRVNCVCPAAIRTYMVEHLPPERQEELIAPQAMRRLGEPNEVAETVTWLLSDRASFITGIAMPVDAGSTAGVTLR
jgi:NAD(P)-dependent dehydrogenase (short-subunit alcohol dehydrogenase family)